MNDRCSEEIIDPEWTNIFRKEAKRERSVVDDLREVPIFSLLSERELDLLARIVHLRRYAPGETIIRRGIPQSGFYLIRTGSVQIVRQHFGGSSEIVAVLRPHELLGEFALVDGSPRSSSLVAAEACELIGFFKPDLMKILTTKPAMGCKILLRLAEEMALTLRRDYDRLRALGFPFAEREPAVAESDLVTAS